MPRKPRKASSVDSEAPLGQTARKPQKAVEAPQKASGATDKAIRVSARKVAEVWKALPNLPGTCQADLNIWTFLPVQAVAELTQDPKLSAFRAEATGCQVAATVTLAEADEAIRRLLAEGYARILHRRPEDPPGVCLCETTEKYARWLERAVAREWRKGRRNAERQLQPLTDRQLEVLRVVGECEENFSEAARRLGLDRKTVRQHYQAAMKKLGRAARGHKTTRLPVDRRGQTAVAADQDRRHQ